MSIVKSDLVKNKKGENLYICKHVILSPFSSLFKKTQYENNEPKYSAAFQFEKDTELARKLPLLMQKIAKDKFDSTSFKHFMYDGDDQADFKTEKEYFQGHYFMRPKSDNKPALYLMDKSPVMDDNGDFFAGCIVNVVVQAYAGSKFGRQVNFSLVAVQKISNPLDSLSLNFGSSRVNPDAYLDDLDDQPLEESTDFLETSASPF